jgi:hypothetical protein
VVNPSDGAEAGQPIAHRPKLRTTLAIIAGFYIAFVNPFN